MIYIDDWMRRPNKEGKKVLCCHMVADSLSELHTFAKRLGLATCWFQKPKKHPHYDIKAFHRYVLALEYGARIVDSKTIVLKSKQMLERKEENLESFDTLFLDWMKFSISAWPKQTPIDCFNKAEEELKEIRDAFDNFEGTEKVVFELIDLTNCVLSGYARVLGLRPEDLSDPRLFELFKKVMRKKIEICSASKWYLNKNGTYSRLKDPSLEEKL